MAKRLNWSNTRLPDSVGHEWRYGPREQSFGAEDNSSAPSFKKRKKEEKRKRKKADPYAAVKLYVASKKQIRKAIQQRRNELLEKQREQFASVYNSLSLEQRSQLRSVRKVLPVKK